MYQDYDDFVEIIYKFPGLIFFCFIANVLLLIKQKPFNQGMVQIISICPFLCKCVINTVNNSINFYALCSKYVTYTRLLF